MNLHVFMDSSLGEFEIVELRNRFQRSLSDYTMRDISDSNVLLHDTHGDMLHRVLERFSSGVEKNARRLTRLEEMAKLARVLAPYSGSRVEAVVDGLENRAKVL